MLPKKKSKMRLAIEFYDAMRGNHPDRAAKLFGVSLVELKRALVKRRLKYLNRCPYCRKPLSKRLRARAQVKVGIPGPLFPRDPYEPNRKPNQTLRKGVGEATQANEPSSELLAPPAVWPQS